VAQERLMHRLYLSRRNLETLLAKLDRGAPQSAIVKNDTSHRKYPTTVPTLVIALEDATYYEGRIEPDAPAHDVLQPGLQSPQPNGFKVSRRRKDA
jgi:hypothetical protein